MDQVDLTQVPASTYKEWQDDASDLVTERGTLEKVLNFDIYYISINPFLKM
jgi:hypothetical protein